MENFKEERKKYVVEINGPHESGPKRYKLTELSSYLLVSAIGYNINLGTKASMKSADFILEELLYRQKSDYVDETSTPTQPQYLFTTDDGVKMNEGDVWWSVVFDGLRNPKETRTMEYKGTKPSKNVGTFSTLEKAYKAALEGFKSERLISLRDISIYMGQLDRLEKIAKNRFLNKEEKKVVNSPNVVDSVGVTNVKNFTCKSCPCSTKVLDSRDTVKFSENDVLKFFNSYTSGTLTYIMELELLKEFMNVVKK
jgi:hypothetical protein